MDKDKTKKELSTIDRVNIIDSAFGIKDLDFKDRILTIGELHEWVNLAPGEFHLSALNPDVGMQMRYAQRLDKMVKMGFVEHVGKKRGWYRPVESDLEEMDFINALDEPVDIWLPFELSDLVEIYVGNVIIIAGAPNVGKTALVLHLIGGDAVVVQRMPGLASYGTVFCCPGSPGPVNGLVELAFRFRVAGDASLRHFRSGPKLFLKRRHPGMIHGHPEFLLFGRLLRHGSTRRLLLILATGYDRRGAYGQNDRQPDNKKVRQF